MKRKRFEKMIYTHVMRWEGGHILVLKMWFQKPAGWIFRYLKPEDRPALAAVLFSLDVGELLDSVEILCGELRSR